MKALRLLKPAAVVDVVAEAEQELARVRAQLDQAQADAASWAREWLHAGSQSWAEEIERSRREAERVAARCGTQLPVLMQRVEATKAARQADGLKRHKAAIAGFVPKLVKAVEAVAEIQVEAIKLRQQAVESLGEQAVAREIPHLALNGILLLDLVALWQREVERIFAPPAAAAPRAVANPARPKPAAVKPAIIPPASVRVVRQLLNDSAPADDGEKLIRILRNGVELTDGRQCGVGDVVRVRAGQASELLRQGAAEEETAK